MYNPKQAEEKKGIEPGTSTKGVISKIEDGKVSDFVKGDSSVWKGDLSLPAINVTVEVQHNSQAYQLQKMFGYREEDGKTIFTPSSNLGKYRKYYGKLPEEGDQVTVIANRDGFFRVVIS